MISHYENFTCFIKGIIPNELALCEVLSVKGKNLFCKVVDIIEQNENRINSDCEIFLNCGGCDYRHISYTKELELKKDLLLNEIEFHKINKSKFEVKLFFGNELHYRNNVQFKILDNQKGFYKNGTNDFIKIPIEGCKTIPDELNRFTLQKNFSGKELKLRILNDKIYNYENEEQKFTLNGKKFLIPKNAFFQINSFLLQTWLNEITNKVQNFDSVLELYSGMGLISIFLAEKNKKIYSFELDLNSIEYAKKNILENQIQNISVFQKNLFKEKVSKKILESDTYFLNPARNGAGKKILQEILEFKPKKIFYSSCNYITLVQDMKLISKEYKLIDLEIFDFFPRTAYFESLASLELNS